MHKNQALTHQDRRFILDLKQALGIVHVGPSAMPRKKVWGDIGRSESWYSLILDPEREDLPSLLDLRRIAAVSGNPEPLRVIAAWWGQGCEVCCDQDPHRMLSENIQLDALFSGGLADALADGRVSQAEAKELLRLAEAKVHQAQTTLDALRKRARGR